MFKCKKPWISYLYYEKKAAMKKNGAEFGSIGCCLLSGGVQPNLLNWTMVIDEHLRQQRSGRADKRQI
ncbi:hypothetical protein B9T34_02410 [Acinetobacter sp. ANC 3813]|nr:hypothetical protein B9T34_02410 [Acinetobacter sp. ANC 3813]